jgi:hypothetical protein
LRVIVPHTKLHEETVKALDRWSTVEPEFIDVSRSNEAYYEALRDVWNCAQGFVVVEHDICIGPETIDSLTNCSDLWCVFPYWINDGYATGLGCTKFSTELIEAVPDLFDVVGKMPDSMMRLKDWHTLDRRIFEALTVLGYAEHLHGPSVIHLKR